MISFVVFALRVEATWKLLGLLEFWVCSYFLDFGCCFRGLSEVSEAYSETFEFNKILGLSEVWVYSYFWVWFLVSEERAEPTRKLLGSFEFWCSNFNDLVVVLAERAEPTRKLLGLLEF